MKQDREDIDWAKLKLIVSKFKKDFGLSEEGRLNWTEELAQNFCLLWKQDASNNQDEEVSNTKEPKKRKTFSTDIAVKKKKF